MIRYTFQLDIFVSGTQFSDPTCMHVHLCRSWTQRHRFASWYLGLVQLCHCTSLSSTHMATSAELSCLPNFVSSATYVQAIAHGNSLLSTIYDHIKLKTELLSKLQMVLPQSRLPYAVALLTPVSYHTTWLSAACVTSLGMAVLAF